MRLSIGHLYIFLTITFTVYGQLIIKWQMNRAGTLPESLVQKLMFLLGMLGNVWIISGFAAAFIAALCWMATMTQFELSCAYPFISLSFVLVIALSALIFNEPITVQKVIGMVLIVAGIIIGSQS